MRTDLLPLLVCLALTEAAPQALHQRSLHSFDTRQALPRGATSNVTPASISQKTNYPEARRAAVCARKEGWWYGPSLIGEAAFFPDGPLGSARVVSDRALWEVDRHQIEDDIKKDITAVKESIATHNGIFKTLDDYINVLYLGKWNESIPAHQAPGIFSNYTQDLLFSMERLTQNPYPVELVKNTASVPFEVDGKIVKDLTGTSLEDLKLPEAYSLSTVSHYRLHET
jgi:hypothetical protein